MLRLKILHAVAALLGFPLTYTVRFIPISGKRADLRGRRVSEPTHDPAVALGALATTQSAPKETIHGTYLLVAEATAGGFFHDPGGVHAGLPGAPKARPAATAPEEAAADEAQGAAGAGTHRRRAARTEAAAGPRQPLGEGLGPAIIGPTGPASAPEIDEVLRTTTTPRSTSRTSLDQLGER